MRSKRFATGIAAATLALLPMTAVAADQDAEVVVVHGVPGLEVDILVDGEAAIENFEFGDVVKTTLPAGTYTLAVAATGATDAVLTLEATLTAGASVTVAAYLDTDGDPKLAALVNETGATGIQPFHLANFGEVDILSGTTAVLEGVANGQTARIDVDGGTTVEAVGIAAAGSTTAAIALGDVTVQANTLVLAYAIGPDTDETLPTVVTETVTVAAVTSVPSGSGGQTALLPMLVLALGLIGSVMLVAPRRTVRSEA